jgi:hypothetical protein
MAIKIEAQLQILPDGIDLKLLEDMTDDITEGELNILNKLKPAFRNFIIAELELNGIIITATYKDNSTVKSLH